MKRKYGIPLHSLSYRADMIVARKSLSKRLPGSPRIGISKSGELVVTAHDGTELTELQINALFEHCSDELRELLQAEAESRNGKLTAIESLHHKIPEPSYEPPFRRDLFTEPRPPLPFYLRLMVMLSKSVRDSVKKERSEWRTRKILFELREDAREIEECVDVYEDPEVMETVLMRHLAPESWPVVPELDVKFSPGHRQIFVSVVLPGLSCIPKERWAVSDEEPRIEKTEISYEERRELYSRYLNAAMLRVTAEVFCRLPATDYVNVEAGCRWAECSEPKWMADAMVGRGVWNDLDFDRLWMQRPQDIVASLPRKPKASLTHQNQTGQRYHS